MADQRRMRAAVLGSPISHSLSPVLHRAAYAELGLPWTYDAIEVTAAGLGEFLAALDESWAGLSLTMPLKEAVLGLLDSVTPIARQTRAANTVLFADGFRHGANTDVEGMVAALRQAAVAGGRDAGSAGSAAVIGAGATARSAIAALAELGVRDIAVTARRSDAARDLSTLEAAFGVRITAEPWQRAVECLVADIVISTVPAGAADHLAPAVPHLAGLLLDVVYSPWPTALATAWLDHEGLVASGFDLLLWQAAGQVRLMTGLEPPVAAMRAAGEAAR